MMSQAKLKYLTFRQKLERKKTNYRFNMFLYIVHFGIIYRDNFDIPCITDEICTIEKINSHENPLTAHQ